MNKDGNDFTPKGFVSFFSLELSSSQYIRGKAVALRGYMGSHREISRLRPFRGRVAITPDRTYIRNMSEDTTSPKLTPQQLVERRVREKEDAAAAWLEYLAEPDLQRKKMAQQRAARLAGKSRAPVKAKKAKAKQAR